MPEVSLGGIPAPVAGPPSEAGTGSGAESYEKKHKKQKRHEDEKDRKKKKKEKKKKKQKHSPEHPGSSLGGNPSAGNMPSVPIL